MVLTVMIVLGIRTITINGLIIKRFLFYRLWIPKRGRTCEGKLGTCNSRCFVRSELHDDASVLKIGHSASVSVQSIFALTRDPYSALQMSVPCWRGTATHLKAPFKRITS